MIGQDNIRQVEHLKDAFQAFNELSEQLASSYQQLEGQVERLNAELAVAHNIHLEQFGQIKSLANRLEHLLEALPGGVVVLDGHGIVQETNPVAIELLGEPLKGIPWREVIQRAFSPRYDDGHDVSLKDGRRVSISTSSLGEEPGQILLIKDVSETRQLQDKLNRYQRLSAMGQMAASLAHQIRTPTASALLYVSNLCRAGLEPDRVQNYGEKIRVQLKHIESMVGDMLSYAKGKTDPTMSEFTADELIRDLGHILHGNALAKSCAINFYNNLSAECLYGNKDAVLGALVNVAMNAINACDKPQSNVEITFSPNSERYIEIKIKDNGKGISGEIKDHIFEPFVTTRAQGTGLGLAIVKSVIEQHGGDIQFESEVNKGTEFRLLLPIANQSHVANHESEQKSELEQEVLL